MCLQIKVIMPNVEDYSRRILARAALEDNTSKAFQIVFVEAEGMYANRIIVECHNKGVGPKKLEKWSLAVRVALEK